MPELLLEIFSEEIPARMQARAAADLERMLGERLAAAGLKAEAARTYVGPRRLAAVLEGLPARSADVREEKKGPRVDAPKQAIEGFLRSAGLKSVEECEVRDDKKGAFYVAVTSKSGRATTDVVAEAVPDLMRAFPWPKSMRSGSGSFRWVRPIHRILCLFDGEVVPFEIEGVASGDQTEGHRLRGRGPFRIKSASDYLLTLQGEGGIVLDAARRRELILSDAKKVCSKEGLELVEDAGLLEEVAGLAEHPTVLLGDMDPSFLDLPAEVIRLTMRTHQKYFAVRDPKTGKLAPRFIIVANQEAPDGGKAIAAGNARVLSARLNDARYFWDNDRKKPLAEMAKGLKDIVFHQKLGSVADKVERVAALARELAPAVGADPDLAEQAARLAKADLVSGMVGEFPELQGVMGRYYAQQQLGAESVDSPPPSWGRGRGGGAAGQAARSPDDRSAISAPHPQPPPHRGEGERLTPAQAAVVADAIRDHYKPAGAGDTVPTEPTAIAVALADKLDTLVGFWAIDEKPTGSKDPYALRRAALGVVRLLVSNDIRLRFSEITRTAYEHLFREDVARAVGDLDLSGLDDIKTEYQLVTTLAERLRKSAPAANILVAPKLGSFRPDLVVETGDTTTLIEIKKNVKSIVDYAEQIGTLMKAAARDRGAVLESLNVFRADKKFAVALAGFVSDRKTFDVERLKVALRDEGHRHDLVDAVFALGEDDLVLIVKRVEALGRFLDTEDGAQLLAAYRRATNILRDEEKKDAKTYDGEPNEAALLEREEKQLHAALVAASAKVATAVKAEKFEDAMAALAPLRPVVDAFFDKVMVNAPDKSLRENRLLLLSRFRAALAGVADFSKIAG